MAEAIAARVRAAHDVDVAWFTVSERDGTIDPPLPSADALHAAVTKPLAAAAASSPRSPIGIEGPSDAAPSAAALIAKGEAAVRLGDHRRANEAFAAARAMQELERSRSASPPGGSRAAGAGAESESDSSGAAVVAAFAPFVLALLPDGAAHLGVAVDAATATNVRARTTTVVGSNPTGGVGGVFVNLGDASETAVARAAAICRDAGVGFVQAALAGDATDARNGTVRAWVASAEGPAVVSAAVTVALAPVCGGGEGNDLRDEEDVREADGEDVREADGEDADDSAASSTRSSVTVLSGSRDPRAACAPRVALLTELVREQASALDAAESQSRELARVREIARRAESDANAAARATTEAESRLDDAIASRRRDLDAAESAFRIERRRLESLLADAEASARSSAEERDALLARLESLETTSRDAETRATIAEARFASANDASSRAAASRDALAAAAEEAARRVEEERAAEKTTLETEIAHLRTRLESARVALSASRRAEGDLADAVRARDAAEAENASRLRERDDARRLARDAERRAEVCLARAEAKERTRDAEAADRESRSRDVEKTLAETTLVETTLAEKTRLLESRLSDADDRAEKAEREVSSLESRLSRTVSPSEYARVVGGVRRVAAAAESAARDAIDAAEETARRATRRAELADRALDESRSSSRRAVEAAVEAATRDADAKVREATARREEDARFYAKKIAALERDAAKNAARADAARETIADAVAAVAADVPPRAGVLVNLAGLDDVVASVASERAANAAAKLACERLERVVRGARACVVAKKPSRRAGKPAKTVVVAAGALSTVVEWFGARGWSSAVAPGSLAGECLEAERGVFARRRRRDAKVFESRPGHAGQGPGPEISGPETPENPGPETPGPETPGHSENFGAAVLARTTCVRGGKTAPGFAVACGPRRALTVDLADRDGAPPPTIPELVAAHEIARVVQAAYDAADDAERRTVRRDARLTRGELRLTGDETIVENGSDIGSDIGSDVTRPTTVAAATRRLETLASRRRLVVSRAAAVECLRESRREGAGPTPRDALALAVSAWAAAATTGDPRCPPMRREDRDAFADAARARRDADAVVEENIREETLARVMRVRPRERDVAADEARVDAARRAARRVATRAMAMWFGGNGGGGNEGGGNGGGVAFGVANRGVGEVIDAFVDDDLRAMRRVDLRAERNLADVERALAIAAPFVFGSRGGEDDGGEGDAREEKGDDDAHADAAMTCWAWAASCVATWRTRRFIAERAKPGVFDLDIVDAEARARAAAGDVVTRYARRYARRFFENAKKRRRAPVSSDDARARTR